MQFWKVTYRVDESDGKITGKYLYVTRQNQSTKPSTIKAGVSGLKKPEDPEQYEDIGRKLNRYSTCLPQNWQPFAIIDISDIAKNKEELKKCEHEFFACIQDAGGQRIENKELFKDISGSDIKLAIERFIHHKN